MIVNMENRDSLELLLEIGKTILSGNMRKSVCLMEQSINQAKNMASLLEGYVTDPDANEQAINELSALLSKQAQEIDEFRASHPSVRIDRRGLGIFGLF